jgi:putative ABC transport system permease protein
MTLARISLFYLWRRRLSTALNVALLAFGVAAVTLLVLTSRQLEERVYRDARGIDLVVGAKGSQTQIVLSGIYQLDVPTGSMRWGDAKEIAAHRGVKRAIPISLGDNYYGFRLVGTTRDYIAHYNGALSEGRLWQEPLEAVLGADVAARLRPRIGSTFVAAHGLLGAGGEPHTAFPYRVVGTLARTGTVADQLVLTDVASYWTVHSDQQKAGEAALVAEPPDDDGRTISALLIQYAPGSGAGDVARFANAFPSLQAASPAFETARLFSIVAVGMDLLRGFALVLLISAALSIFIALYHGLNERRYDLAVMRTLGATRENIMSLLLFEGMLLAVVGAVLGLFLGHLLTSVLGFALRQAQQISVTGWTWYAAELWIVLLALIVGVLTALLPAWRAHEVDIASTLARG